MLPENAFCGWNACRLVEGIHEMPSSYAPKHYSTNLSVCLQMSEILNALTEREGIFITREIVKRKGGDQILANIGPIRREDKPVVVSTINPWSEEGSGDLLGEALFPAITPKNEVHLTGESQKETGKAVAVSNNINGNEANEKILNLSKQMHMVV
ncbi:hypothetical protein AVEN_213795-1 [Araneus ventricosus]|uniref:Uncharacterized protein n=1 Tax=Araneus ventricosus TaxID=182803 RepID=A0A4Y2X8N7_ARAVE|nr:hypothetical protein AVEN_213795-1 [Araneus ventricosus]